MTTFTFKTIKDLGYFFFQNKAVSSIITVYLGKMSKLDSCPHNFTLKTKTQTGKWVCSQLSEKGEEGSSVRSHLFHVVEALTAGFYLHVCESLAASVI